MLLAKTIIWTKKRNKFLNNHDLYFYYCKSLKFFFVVPVCRFSRLLGVQTYSNTVSNNWSHSQNMGANSNYIYIYISSFFYRRPFLLWNVMSQRLTKSIPVYSVQFSFFIFGQFCLSTLCVTCFTKFTKKKCWPTKKYKFI